VKRPEAAPPSITIACQAETDSFTNKASKLQLMLTIFTRLLKFSSAILRQHVERCVTVCKLGAVLCEPPSSLSSLLYCLEEQDYVVPRYCC
jgi:hypothetical protein